MKPIKLKTSGVKNVSKAIPVEDVNGNKHILKATVFSVSAKKDVSTQIVDAQVDEHSISDRIVRPPLNQAELSVLQEISSELGQTIDSMVVGIEGFGGRLILRKMSEEMKEESKAQISEERTWLNAFFEFPNPNGSFVKLRKETREDLESTGNAYWELIPTKLRNGRYASIEKLEAGTVYISKPDKNFTTIEARYLDENLEIRTKKFQKRLRRFVQVVGNKKVWFKEFSDPRDIDNRTGNPIDPSDPTAKNFLANEIVHFKIYTPRKTPYGLPRYTGNLIAIKGSRSADETNIITQQNNHVPSMAITVAGGALTDGSIQRIQEFVDTQIRGDSNYSKFLLLEGESSHDALSGQSSMKIDIKTLSEAQHKDQLWQEYDKANASKIRRSFRVAPIMVGSSENYDRSTATTSEAMTEKYVYNPEREDMDVIINQLFVRQGIRFWKFKSNSPNVTNDEDLVAILTGAEKSGALTPRIGRMLLEDILNRELPSFDEMDLPEDFNPDLPFSYTLAKLMHEAGAANQNGTFAPQGQIPKNPKTPGARINPSGGNHPSDMMEDDSAIDPSKALDKFLERPEQAIAALIALRDRLEDQLDTESFGKPRKDFFDHGHN